MARFITHDSSQDIHDANYDNVQTAPVSDTIARDLSNRRRIVLRSLTACAVVVVLTVLAGCGSDNPPTTSSSASSAPAASASSTASGSSSAYPSGKEEVCAARDQLKTSLAALVSPTVLAGGASSIDAALEKVQTDLSAVAAAGKQDYGPQVKALQDALAQAKTVLSNLGDGNTTANASAITPAVAAIQTSGAELFTQLSTDCD